MSNLIATHHIIDTTTQTCIDQSTSIQPIVKGQGIIIVGGSGAGKTTLGKHLANVMELPFIDSDNLIELTSRDTIANIFNYHKEIGFRWLEAQAICNCLKNHCIISLGAGAMEDKKTRELINKSGFIALWLDESPNTAWTRIAGDQSRPLVTTYDQFLARWTKRIPAWSEAKKIFPSKLSPYSLAKEIAKSYGNLDLKSNLINKYK